MSKHFKLLTILLSVILCFSAVTFVVGAIDADGDGYDDETGEFVGGGSSAVEPDPTYYTDPYVEPEPDYTDPYVEPEPDYTDPYVEPEPDYTEPYYNPGSSDTGGDNSYVADPPSYVGGGQSYVAPVSTAPSVPLIDSDNNIDVNELSSNDWKAISASLKNANNNSGSDSDDFGFIQNNNSSGDNGQWLLITGILLILLSLSGISYFIFSAVSRRKKFAYAGTAQKPAAYENHYHLNDDYGDGYRVSKKNNKKKTDRSRKYDTADIKLPKNSNGNRYR